MTVFHPRIGLLHESDLPRVGDLRHTSLMTDTSPRRRPLGPALTIVPVPGTAVMDLYTRELGRVTGDAGYADRHDGAVAVALVWFEGRPHEDVVFVTRLVLADE